MSKNKDIDKFLSLCSSKVQNNITVITSEELDKAYLLHISENSKLPDLVPRIGPRQASSEDKTVPRITTAPTIIGCMIGHVSSEQVFLYNHPTQDYKGGYYIYGFEFDVALRPSKELVYDANKSDEHWLVTYNEDTVKYKPVLLGKYFIQSITYEAKSGSNSVPTSAVLIFEITSDIGIDFNKKIRLTKGYWKIEGPLYSNIRSWETSRDFTASGLDKSEYDAIKLASAEMLNLKDPIPAYAKW